MRFDKAEAARLEKAEITLVTKNKLPSVPGSSSNLLLKKYDIHDLAYDLVK